MTRLTTLAAALMAGTMATTALAAVDKVAKVDVTADLSAIQNETAAKYWSTLETDLEAAITARVTERLADEGASILVDLREVELAGAFERQLNLGDAVLVGQVNITDQTNNSNYDAYELSVSLESAKVAFVDGAAITLVGADTTQTYQRLVETFADEVVSRLK